MRGICPNCEKEQDLDLIQSQEEIEVRGELISVSAKYYRCRTCGDEFEDPGSNDDPLDKAYREYRSRHGMLQPEDIRSLRKKYGLTQHEFAKLLGWGLATLSRYENGALQDEAHDKTLRLALEPKNLMLLVKETPDGLSREREEKLTAKLKASEEATCSLERVYEERFGTYKPDILSGYKTLDLQKLFNAIIFFCMEGLWKTVLNKEIFYADFKHFKGFSNSITGARYVRVPLGPVPDKWQYFFTLLIEDGVLESEEIFYDENISGERLTSIRKPDLSIFGNSELLTMSFVKEHFKGWTAKRISEFSHNEKGYKETPHRHLISYEYADDLQI
jgi:putative zinc finger/helix-turn-helix YgiT family protein